MIHMITIVIIVYSLVSPGRDTEKAPSYYVAENQLTYFVIYATALIYHIRRRCTNIIIYHIMIRITFYVIIISNVRCSHVPGNIECSLLQTN